MTDLKLNNIWQLTPDANGDAALINDYRCIIQNLCLEAQTQEGDLFYDTEYGWSLLDFIHSEDSELTKVEIRQRVSDKLKKHDFIEQSTIKVTATFSENAISIKINFDFTDGSSAEINIDVNRITAEVIII